MSDWGDEHERRADEAFKDHLLWRTWDADPWKARYVIRRKDTH